MTRAYVNLAFTPNVTVAQDQWGTSAQVAPARDHDIEAQDGLTPPAVAFVRQTNSAFLATVNSEGWPYVQHRGGQRGFIHVLDEKKIVMPDFDGNGQLLTVGNLATSSRAMLLLIDFKAKRRLKLWGHARVVPAKECEVVVELEGARRALIFEIQAMNFNCPAYLPEIADEIVTSFFAT
ncbi:MAG: pyridoxamine 5'-phosphate oxidase family protein [Burkholderiaceae bacterium]|nr:pyridoxamine 5'-phosphate oxidase family protein [Burkholderiaceae bacterium]